MGEKEAEAETAHNPFNIATFEQDLVEIFSHFQLTVKRRGTFIKVTTDKAINATDLFRITVGERTFVNLRLSDEMMQLFRKAIELAFQFSFDFPHKVTFENMIEAHKLIKERFPSSPEEISRGDLILNIVSSFIMRCSKSYVGSIETI